MKKIFTLIAVALMALNVSAKEQIAAFSPWGEGILDGNTYTFNGLNHTTLENYMNTLGTGVYFINAVSELGSQTVKLVVTK